MPPVRRTRTARNNTSSSPPSLPRTPPTSPPRAEKTAFTYTPGYHHTYGLMDDPDGAVYMQSDFLEMKIEPNKIAVMMAIKEPEVDHFAQRMHGSHARAREEAATKAARVEKRRASSGRAGRNRAPQYKFGLKDGGSGGSGKGGNQVFVDGTERWVLFDPLRGWPATMDREPPAAYERLAQFIPGNGKIVVFNLESYSVALRTTPAMFDGMVVQYTKAGPRLVKVKRG